jgi:hypothetical protein
MVQQGQVFKLKAKGAEAEPLWAYRYRLEGRGSARPQVGGFASRAEAQKALTGAREPSCARVRRNRAIASSAGEIPSSRAAPISDARAFIR